MNLMTSFSDGSSVGNGMDGDLVGGKGGPAIDSLDDDLCGNWIGEYRMGCEWEVTLH